MKTQIKVCVWFMRHVYLLLELLKFFDSIKWKKVLIFIWNKDPRHCVSYEKTNRKRVYCNHFIFSGFLRYFFPIFSYEFFSHQITWKNQCWAVCLFWYFSKESIFLMKKLVLIFSYEIFSKKFSFSFFSYEN